MLRTIRALTSFAVVAAAVLVLDTATARAETISSDQTGVSDGFYYSFWTDGAGSASMTVGPGGRYSVTWSRVGDVLAGVGWSVGGRRTVTYSGAVSTSGNVSLGVHGWTTNPRVEYFIVDDYGAYRPHGAMFKGSVSSDGDAYDLYETDHLEGPSTLGTPPFRQYWSVRRTRRLGGTITVGNHIDAWARAGMTLGAFEPMTLAVEGYQGSGNARITVSSPAP